MCVQKGLTCFWKMFWVWLPLKWFCIWQRRFVRGASKKTTGQHRTRSCRKWSQSVASHMVPLFCSLNLLGDCGIYRCHLMVRLSAADMSCIFLIIWFSLFLGFSPCYLAQGFSNILNELTWDVSPPPNFICNKKFPFFFLTIELTQGSKLTKRWHCYLEILTSPVLSFVFLREMNVFKKKHWISSWAGY